METVLIPILSSFCCTSASHPSRTALPCPGVSLTEEQTSSSHRHLCLPSPLQNPLRASLPVSSSPGTAYLAREKAFLPNTERELKAHSLLFFWLIDICSGFVSVCPAPLTRLFTDAHPLPLATAPHQLPRRGGLSIAFLHLHDHKDGDLELTNPHIRSLWGLDSS